ncbi:MAG: hypothetical protein JSR72_12900 [Proteobacteria bacterium]|nr:hypothetical protein [Pseudomonadota bacterium]
MKPPRADGCVAAIRARPPRRMVVDVRYGRPLGSVKARERRQADAEIPHAFLPHDDGWAVAGCWQRLELGRLRRRSAPARSAIHCRNSRQRQDLRRRFSELPSACRQRMTFYFVLVFFAAQHASDATIGLIESRQTTREALVNLALRLNVLAVCAVFAFVGAVLLGAF